MLVLLVQPLRVHGDIRHLESNFLVEQISQTVHGDIRHLEMFSSATVQHTNVHGDIRHLENTVQQHR